MPRNTVYNKCWEQTYNWIAPVIEDETLAFCKLCSKTFRINNSGIQQVKQHAGSVKHSKKTTSITSTQSTFQRSATGTLALVAPRGSKFYQML